MRYDHDVIVIGAGIAGAALAYHLSLAGQAGRVLLLDRQQPLSFTTAKSGENFRMYWPQDCMAELSARSIDLMQALTTDLDADFGMKFSGYDFVSHDLERDIFPPPTGLDRAWSRETDPETLRTRHPYLSDKVRQVTTVHEAGVIDVNALGSWLLAQARSRGVELRKSEVHALAAIPNGYRLRTQGKDGDVEFTAHNLVLAAGPFNTRLAAQLGVDLPILEYLQRKIALPDPEGVIPRDMPFTICADALDLDWSDEEKDLIARDPAFSWLLDTFPAGLHIKPEPGGRIKMGWAFNREPAEPDWDPQPDDTFADVVMRGASRFIPGLQCYVENMPTPIVSYAGYYSRTPDNLPLIGPLGPDGLYTLAALSGFGTMVACAAGELCAAHMRGDELPAYAPYFGIGRYSDLGLMAEISAFPADGQL